MRCAAHGALLCAAALLLAACSPAGSGNQTTQGSNSAAVGLAPQDSGTPSSTATVAVTTSSRTTTAASDTPGTSSTPTTTANPLPGGTTPAADLAAYLDGGRISLPAVRAAAETGAFEHDDAAEGVATEADQVAADLCAYLFGTAEEVSEITRLPGAIHLGPLSGPHLTDSDDDAEQALVIACVYADDAGPQVVLQVGDGPPVDPDLPGRPIIVTGDAGSAAGEVQAVLSYAPDHTAPGIDARLARDWLTAVLGRVTP